MITSQLSMFGLQSEMGPDPMTNLGTRFLPFSGTLVRSIVMSITGYPFGWNWNNKVSAQIVNLTRNVTPLSVLPYP